MKPAITAPDPRPICDWCKTEPSRMCDKCAPWHLRELVGESEHAWRWLAGIKRVEQP